MNESVLIQKRRREKLSDNRKNIFLKNTKEVLPYVSKGSHGEKKIPQRDDPLSHAEFISKKILECREKSLSQEQVAAIRYKDGMYLGKR